jgi:hypothetical protein
MTFDSDKYEKLMRLRRFESASIGGAMRIVREHEAEYDRLTKEIEELLVPEDQNARVIRKNLDAYLVDRCQPTRGEQ